MNETIAIQITYPDGMGEVERERLKRRVIQEALMTPRLPLGARLSYRGDR